MRSRAIVPAVILLLAPAAGAYDSIRFLEPIKGPEMLRPAAAALSGGRVFVTDEKKDALLIYDAAGKLLKSVGGRGDGKGQFRGPRGVAVGPDGRVYVADVENHRVQIFDRDGAFAYAFGEKGSEPGKMRSPQSVAVGADGRIYVADTGNDRVQVFTAEGILLYQIGGPGSLPGQLREPTRVVVAPSDAVYVVDRGNGRIQQFDAAARPAREFPLRGNDADVDAYGFLYLLDGRDGKVVEESPDGRPIGRFGSYGTGVGQMRRAEGISISADGTVVVVDTGNGRVHLVELTNKLKKTPLPSSGAAKLGLTGPTRDWPVAAAALAAFDDSLYAYVPTGGPFVVLGPDGKIQSRFGAAKGKGGDVTRVAGGLAVSKAFGVFVSDADRSRLQRFSLAGRWQANIGEAQGFFDSTRKEGRMRRPGGVAVNESGTVYVADTDNQRVDAFSPDGVFVFSIGPKLGDYRLQKPVAVAWDRAGFLYILDRGLGKVFKCEPSGAFLAAWGEEGSGPGQFRDPVSIAFDAETNLYVLDAKLRRISVYTRHGEWLTDLFAGGRGPRELEDPVAIAVQGHRLAIADRGKGRIAFYDLHPQLAPPLSVSTSTREGVVTLSWPESGDSWTEDYRVSRASQPAGPYAVVGAVPTARFQDSDVGAYQRYWYRVAVAAKTGDIGPWSPAAETFVAGSFNRAPIEISSVTLGRIFAANYKWYLQHPVGTVQVTNNVNVPFLNVKVTFKLKDYMDFGFDTEIKKLEPRQTAQIPLIATLNNKVLEVTEDTPIQAEFSLHYFEKGEERTVSLTKPLRLYSRNAITWDDTRKIANFITFKDGPIKDFKSALTEEFKNPKAEALNRNAVQALRIWGALGEYGVRFAANPANPFETAHDDPNFPVDYTQYPRETLKRKTGQCSDLTSLYAALLEDSEVRVALLDYPGHITLMLDTEAEDAAEAGLPPELLVEHDGTMWLPVEVTYVGKPFYEAVSNAAYAYKAEAAKGRVKIIDVDKTFEEYEPVTMPPDSFMPTLPPAAAVERRYDEQVAVLAKERYQFLKKFYGDQLTREPDDVDAQLQLAIVDYQFGAQKEAVAGFDKVLAADPKNAAALNNLGSAAFLAGDYQTAEKRFLQSVDSDAADANVWLNLMKTAIKRQEPDEARVYGTKAAALEAGYKPFVDNLLNGL